MPTKAEIEAMLDELETKCADDLEGQELDFKEWNAKSYSDMGALILETVICLANAGGGSVVVGVRDGTIGRANALLGVPSDVDPNKLKRHIYDNTDPRLTPLIEELHIPEGSGRIIIIQVHAGMPPYTDSKGRAKIRVGKDCQPFTGSMRRQTLASTGELDFTATKVEGSLRTLISPLAMARLREVAQQEQAPEDLLRKSDTSLLRNLGVLTQGGLTKAGVLLIGNETAIAEYFPGYAWTYLGMKSDIDYYDRDGGNHCLIVALDRIMARIGPRNPVTTIRQGLFHFEFRTYPEIALREAILNAFCHADYSISGPIHIKQFPDRLEIANPGGFIGGVSPNNILRHDPVTRNPLFVNALTVLRLVNRSNLGVRRMYSAMLQEGKEPPILRDEDDAVRVVLLASEFSVPFRTFVAEEANRNHWLAVEDLLVLQYLLRHGEIELSTVMEICQQHEREARESVHRLDKQYRILEASGRRDSGVWRLRAEVERALTRDTSPTRSRQQQLDAAISTVLRALRERYDRGEHGLTNAELRELTHLNRDQMKYVMSKIRKEGMASSTRGAHALWTFVPSKNG